MMWNALESCVKAMPIWKQFHTDLKGITDFLRDKGLRLRFQAVCLRDNHVPAFVVELFNSFSENPVDWRWETLETSLDTLLPLLPYLFEHFSFDRITGAVEDLGKTQKACVKVVHDVICSVNRKQEFMAMAEGLHAATHTVGRCARWCEGYSCHEITKTTLSKAKRRRILEDSLGKKRCPWAGCRACDLARGQVNVFLQMVTKLWLARDGIAPSRVPP